MDKEQVIKCIAWELCLYCSKNDTTEPMCKDVDKPCETSNDTAKDIIRIIEQAGYILPDGELSDEKYSIWTNKVLYLQHTQAQQDAVKAERAKIFTYLDKCAYTWVNGGREYFVTHDEWKRLKEGG